MSDGLADAGKFFRWQNAGGGRGFGAGDFPPDGAGGDLDLGVVADALALSQFAVGQEVEFVFIFGKPDGCVHGEPAFAEGC